MTSKPTGHSYLRFSSKKQGKGDSVRRQTEDTVAGESPASWCVRNKVTLNTSLTYRDLGVSSWTGRNATHGALKDILEAIDAGLIRPGDYLLVEKIDRITRQGVDEGLEIIKRILRKGVSIVTLANGRVYGPDAVKGLMKGLLELQMYLEQAKEFSDTLSGRVRAAWEGKRKKARAGGTLATKAMPPWLAPAGKGDERRAVVVADKAAVVRRIFDLAISGQGLTAIVREMIENDVQPITRGGQWSRTSVRRILSDRTVIGEYQPMRGRGADRVPDGDPIEGYYPVVIRQATFRRARTCMGSRKIRNVGRQSKLLNLFSGLLRDGRTGESYVTALRVEGGGKRHHVLMSASKTGGAYSFPYSAFEAAVLNLLREIDPREILPQPAAAGCDPVRDLEAELSGLDEEIAAVTAAMDAEYSEVLLGVLRRKEAKRKDVAGRLTEAKQEAASPLGESWGEAVSIMAALDKAPDRPAAMLRLRAVLRRVVESVTILVVPRGRDRLAAVQVRFNGSEQRRDYLILCRPPKSNGAARVEGGWCAWSFADVTGTAANEDFDLRAPADVGRVAAVVEGLDLDTMLNGVRLQ